MDENAVNYDADAQVADNSTCTYEPFEKTQMLTNICDNYIIPAYTNFNEKNIALSNSVSGFSSNPTVDAFEALKQTWKDALLSWQQVCFLDFGPAAFVILNNQVNIYPVGTDKINNNINLGVYNLELADNNDAKGFQALDYLLHQPGMTDEDHVTYFTTNSNAMVYLIDVVENINYWSNYVLTEWTSTYQENFKSNSSSESNAQGSSISNLVNGLCYHYESIIRKGKIGLPLGAFNGFSQQEMPDLVECYYRQESLPFAIASVNAMKKYINGESFSASENRLGLDDYINFVGATQNSNPLSTVINSQIDQIIDKLEQLNDPLSNEIITNKPAVTEAYSSLQQLVPYLKADLTSALGVIITYQDNDGD
jgi:predicted lipoprotein